MNVYPPPPPPSPHTPQVLTANMVDFEAPTANGLFDRVVSIEMFEHMKNYQRLLRKVGGSRRSAGGMASGRRSMQTHPACARLKGCELECRRGKPAVR